MKHTQAALQRPVLTAFLKRGPLLMKSAFVLLAAVCMAQLSTAQVSDPIQADISHSFVVGNTTLPPGTYTFRVLPDSDMSVMTVTSSDGKYSVEFLVREAKADHSPQHSDVIFNRYGQKEFLARVFEQGSKIGVAIAEAPRQELRLQKQGQHPIEHGS